MKDKSSYIIQFITFSVFPILIGGLVYNIGNTGIVRNYFPDALWAFSFTYLLQLIWGKINFYTALLLTISFIGFELLQHFGLVPGTFDILDITTYFISSLFSILVYEKNKNRFNRTHI